MWTDIFGIYYKEKRLWNTFRDKMRRGTLLVLRAFRNKDIPHMVKWIL